MQGLPELSLTLLNHAIPYILLGVISLKILEKFTDNPIDALALTHAVESNRTTDMNFISWKFTVLIKENATINNLARYDQQIPIIFLADRTTYYDATTIPNENHNQIELREDEYLVSPVSSGLYEGK
ncbi:unnamed protein product, partial [Rotaria sp. Silwood1]